MIATPEIDQQISLCNLKTKTWNRILFKGDSDWIEDVVWVSNTKFILAGIEQKESVKRIPKILIGDRNSESFDIYSSNDQKCFQKNRYKSSRLKKMKIEGL